MGSNLLLERVLHVFDGGLASPFLGRLGKRRAAAGGELADQSKVTALQLAGRELLRRNRRLLAAAPAALDRCCGTRGSSTGRGTSSGGDRFTGASRRATRTSRRASRRATRTATG